MPDSPVLVSDKRKKRSSSEKAREQNTAKRLSPAPTVFLCNFPSMFEPGTD